MTPHMHHIFGGEITMKFEIVKLIGHKAFVICVQDLMTQTNRQKYIMICTIGGSKTLAVRNIIIDCFINKRVKVGFKIKYCTNLFRPQQQQT